MQLRRISFVAALCWIVATLIASAPVAAGAVYDADGDARVSIQAAAERAKTAGKRVVVVFGADWCNWCGWLHASFTDTLEIQQVLAASYEVVEIGIGDWDKNLDVAAGYGIDLKAVGIPQILVLDSDGKLLIHQPAEALETKDPPGYDDAKILDFLEQWRS